MLLKAYSIRDAKAEIFYPPYYKQTHGEAERDFCSLVNEEKSQVHKYPEDFDLYFVGSFDDQSGLLSHIDTPQHVAKGVNMLRCDTGLRASN